MTARRPPARRHANAIDVVALVVIVVGCIDILTGPWPGRPSLPPVETRVLENGRRVAVVDFTAWENACREAGLPAPTSLDGADPIPVRRLMDEVESWIQTGSAESLGRIGQIYQALEEHEAALGCFAAASEADPTGTRWRYHLGAQCQAVGLAERALDILTRVTRSDPDYATTYARLGLLHLEAGDLDEAEAAYRRYVERRPDISLGYVGLGRTALARGDTAAALRLLTEAATRTPNDFMARRFLARALAADGQDAAARRQMAVSQRLPVYSGWLTFDPRLAASHELADTQRYLENQARQAIGRNDFPALVEVLERLIERRPDDFAILDSLANTYRGLERLDEAERTVRRAIELKPDSAALYGTLAEVAFVRGDHDGAFEAAETALKLDPMQPKALDIRARVLYTRGEVAAAIESMRRAVALNPNAPKSKLAFATMLVNGGLREEAGRVLRDLLERQPQNEVAARMLRQLEGGP